MSTNEKDCPNIIVHTKLGDPVLADAFGRFVYKDQKVHVTEKELLYKYVVTHEIIHWEHRNSLIGRFLTLFEDEKSLVWFCSWLAVGVLLMRIFPTTSLYLFSSIILVGMIPFDLFMIEEYRTDRETRKRCGQQFTSLKTQIQKVLCLTKETK